MGNKTPRFRSPEGKNSRRGKTPGTQPGETPLTTEGGKQHTQRVSPPVFGGWEPPPKKKVGGRAHSPNWGRYTKQRRGENLGRPPKKLGKSPPNEGRRGNFPKKGFNQKTWGFHQRGKTSPEKFKKGKMVFPNSFSLAKLSFFYRGKARKKKSGNKFKKPGFLWKNHKD